MSEKTSPTVMVMPFAGIIAALISWVVNHSIGYAVLHFFCGIFYVIYALFAHADKLFGG